MKYPIRFQYMGHLLENTVKNVFSAVCSESQIFINALSLVCSYLLTSFWSPVLSNLNLVATTHSGLYERYVLLQVSEHCVKICKRCQCREEFIHWKH